MNGVTVRKADGESININVIRYFNLNNFSYLIFSLNEIDDGGYVKLYISKIVNGAGVTITDDVEWNLVKDTIKDIIKRNKDGIPNGINDLNENELMNIIISDQKVFKLNDSLLQLLSANKNVAQNQEETIIEENVNDIIDQQPVLDMDLGKVNENVISNQPIPSVPITDINMENNSIEPDIEIQKPLVPDVDSSLYYGVETSNSNNDSKTSSSTEDYKTMYEEELKKNEELLQELKKYQSLINDLKEVLK